MDDNRFFKTIWRFNAMAIAVLLLVAVGLMAWEMGLRRVLNPRTVQEVVNIDETDTSVVQTQKLRVTGKVEGHDLFLVSIDTEQTYDTTYSSKGTGRTELNIGLFDPKSGDTTWVFPTRDQMITDVKTIYTTPSLPNGRKRSVAHSLLITFVDTDTNGDQRLTNSDAKSVTVRKIGDPNPKLILENLQSDPRPWEISGGLHVLFFTKDNVQQSAIYDPDTMTVQNISALPAP